VATANETTKRYAVTSHHPYKHGHLIRNEKLRASNTGKVSIRKDVKSKTGKI
jgi:hypothetical protein